MIFAQHSPITIETLGQVLTSVGLSATLILFFVWQNWKREERVATEFVSREKSMVDREEKIVERLQRLEDFTRKELMELTRDTGVALASNTIALQNNTKALDHATQSGKANFEAIAAIRDELRAHDQLTRAVAEQLKGKGKPA